MPELPEVESVRRQLDPALAARTVVEVWADPIPSIPRQFMGLHRLAGRTIASVSRRGKFLIAPLDHHLELIMHLGMTGQLGFDRPRDPFVRARLLLDDARTLSFRDVRRFGRMAVVDAGNYEAIPTLAQLGPEPLSHEFDVKAFAAALARTRAPVKPFLMSQRAVAGVGNIYADEALWLARIHPASRRVGPERATRLHRAVREVLAAAVEREGTTFRDYMKIDGEPGRNAGFLIAYGRAGMPCPRCATPLKKIVLWGRGTTFCPRCQRA
jgi:formamidopyrimidine-DNA glycosylase